MAPSDWFRRQCRIALRKLCAQTALLPMGCVLVNEIEFPTNGPVVVGGFGEVRKGSYAGQPVALKTPRVFIRSSDTLSKVSSRRSLYPSLRFKLFVEPLPGSRCLAQAQASEHC
jgi:hypothetical protein